MRLSVPSQRILRHDRGTDELRSRRPASSTAARIPTSSPAATIALVRRRTSVPVASTAHKSCHDARPLPLPHVLRVDQAA